MAEVGKVWEWLVAVEEEEVLVMVMTVLTLVEEEVDSVTLIPLVTEEEVDSVTLVPLVMEEEVDSVMVVSLVMEEAKGDTVMVGPLVMKVDWDMVAVMAAMVTGGMCTTNFLINRLVTVHMISSLTETTFVVMTSIGNIATPASQIILTATTIRIAKTNSFKETKGSKTMPMVSGDVLQRDSTRLLLDCDPQLLRRQLALHHQTSGKTVSALELRTSSIPSAYRMVKAISTGLTVGVIVDLSMGPIIFITVVVVLILIELLPFNVLTFASFNSLRSSIAIFLHLRSISWADLVAALFSLPS